VTLDHDACYRALAARDARFDGRLFVGVTTTGIYCRPVCPASTAKRAHCRFFPSAAAAQEAGFRPCLRCRPETAPAHGSWNGSSNTVARGLALIAEGALDRDDASVDSLAERLGIGERQLLRLFQQHLGASPIAVAQTRRLLFAKQLIHETRLPMAEIALAAGFGSVRRFNETFHALYERPPSSLRRTRSSARAVPESAVTVRLRYRPPYDFERLLRFLAARAVTGVERVESDRYERTLVHEGLCGSVQVEHRPAETSLAVTLRFPNVRVLPGVIARVRRVFDLDVDMETVGAHLQQDPWLAPLVAARPGLRTPGAWDGFELGVRAIVGQQVTVAGASTIAGRLVDRLGNGTGFPDPEVVASADLSGLGLTTARASTVRDFAALMIEGDISHVADVKGVGPWTADYIALRLGDADAFPVDDLGLRRAAGNGTALTRTELRTLSERWRPWRALAAAHLWMAAPHR